MEDDKRQECSQPTAPEYRWQDFATICVRCKEYVRVAAIMDQNFFLSWSIEKFVLEAHRGMAEPVPGTAMTRCQSGGKPRS